MCATAHALTYAHAHVRMRACVHACVRTFITDTAGKIVRERAPRPAAALVRERKEGVTYKREGGVGGWERRV